MRYCGIDIGTTNTKAVLLGADLAPLDRLSLPSAAAITGDRIDAEIWVRQVRDILRRFAGSALGEGPLVCCLAAQGGSFVRLDEKFRPVEPGYLWTGRAGEATIAAMEGVLAPTDFYRRTGWPLSAWLMAAKLGEINRSNSAAPCRYLATVPDFVHARLAGRFVSDITNAQITGLYDFSAGRWHEPTLAWAGVDAAQLPAVETAPGIVSDDCPALPGPVRFATSLHDQYAVMKAAALEPDRSAMLATGTAWVLNAATSAPRYDEPRCLLHPGRGLGADAFGAIVAMGPVGRGFDQLCRQAGLSPEQIDAGPAAPSEPIEADLRAGTVAGGAAGALAMRRYQEAAAAAVAWLLEQLQLDHMERLVMTGGATRSEFWPWVLAQVCGVTVEVLRCDEFTAWGAALTAYEAAQGRPAAADAGATLVERHSIAGDEARQYRSWYEEIQRPFLNQKM